MLHNLHFHKEKNENSNYLIIRNLQGFFFFEYRKVCKDTLNLTGTGMNAVR